MYKDGVEVYNMSSSSSSAASDAVLEASCVVGDKLSCGLTFDNDKQLTVYFSKNNYKVLCVIVLVVTGSGSGSGSSSHSTSSSSRRRH